MTKAFTSALGYGITVRGYIDEDDKLVLLEPEGGGGAYNTASVTIRPDPVTSTAPSFTVQCVEVADDGTAGPGNFAFEVSTLEFKSLTNAGMFFLEANGYEFTAVSGVEPIEADVTAFVITGDAVITYKEV